MTHTLSATTQRHASGSDPLADDIALCVEVLGQLEPEDLRGIPPKALVRGLVEVPSWPGYQQRDRLHLLDDAFFASLTCEQARAILEHGRDKPFIDPDEVPLSRRISSTVMVLNRPGNRMSAMQVVQFLAHIADQPPSALYAFFDTYGNRISPEVRTRIQSTRSLLSWARATSRSMEL